MIGNFEVPYASILITNSFITGGDIAATASLSVVESHFSDVSILFTSVDATLRDIQLTSTWSVGTNMSFSKLQSFSMENTFNE